MRLVFSMQQHFKYLKKAALSSLKTFFFKATFPDLKPLEFSVCLCLWQLVGDEDSLDLSLLLALAQGVFSAG